MGKPTIETYIRKGLEAQKEKNDEEAYTIRDYTILDVNWGQYIQKRDQGKSSKGEKRQGNRLRKGWKKAKNT